MNNFRPQGFSLLPSVVKNLLIINGLVFITTYVLQNTIGIDLNNYFALYFPGSESFKPHQLITHLFMHGNFFHLFSNMLALWMFGATLENFWGPKRFFIFYFVTGLGAAFLHTAIQYAEIVPLQNAISDYLSNPTPASFEAFTFQHVPSNFKPVFVQLVDAWNANPNSISIKDNTITIAKELANIRINVPTVGASGAVFGLLLAFGMLFPNTLIYIYFFFPLKAKYFVALYGAFELYSGIQNNPSDNVAHFAHLGGMLFGYILIKYWQKNQFRQY